jgi:hypothetical protein
MLSGTLTMYPRLICPLDDPSPGRSVTWTICPWTIRPLDDPSPGQSVPWTKRPCDKASPWGRPIRLQAAAEAAGSEPPGPGPPGPEPAGPDPPRAEAAATPPEIIVEPTSFASLALGMFCHKKNLSEFLKWGLIVRHQIWGRFVTNIMGTDRPGDGSSKGQIVQGMFRPGDGSFGDASSGYLLSYRIQTRKHNLFLNNCDCK